MDEVNEFVKIDTDIMDAVEADRLARKQFGLKDGSFLVLTDEWSMSDNPWAIYFDDEGERCAVYIAGPFIVGDKLIMIPCSHDGKQIFNVVAFKDKYCIMEDETEESE